jgi:hypothetical protein
VQKSDLPFGSEFSPSQIDLPHVLELTRQYSGDGQGFEKAVLDTYFVKNNTSDYNKRKLANNVKLGMIAYGLIDRHMNLTAFGEYLYSLRNEENQLYQELARHILLNLHGMTLVQCVLDIQAAGEDFTLEKLREWLEQRGVHFPRGGKHPSMMHLWLKKVGVFAGEWRVDEDKYKQILGISETDIEALSRFTPEQRAYLKTLANMGGTGPYLSNDIERLASTTYGVKFSEKAFAQKILYPLRDAGYITLERGTKDAGRGAKPSFINPTEKLDAELVIPLLNQFEKQVGAELVALQRKSLADILEELNSSDTYIRGLALEALAFKLMRLVDLSYVSTRLRGAATGGAEVDVLFESSRLAYSRWQIQCKNTRRVSLDDVAKEVGLTHTLKSNVIVMVSTGEIGPEARRYANKIMQDSNLCIIMIDRTDIQAIKGNPAAIVNVLNREARHAMKLKELDI